MRKILCLAIVFGAFACNSGEEKEITTDIVKNPNSAQGDLDLDLPAMTFKEVRVDFGELMEGEKTSKTFEFTNTGKADLIINNVTAGCGCTVPKTWPKEPIAPGKTGKIEVTFNSEGKSGQQVKQIMVQANTNPSVNTVALVGQVLRKDAINEIGKQ